MDILVREGIKSLKRNTRRNSVAIKLICVAILVNAGALIDLYSRVNALEEEK